MKKIVFVHLLFLLLVTTFVTSAHAPASLKVQTVVSQDIHVTLSLVNINSTVYIAIRNGNLIDESTIPAVIKENLGQQNLTQVDVYTQPIVFNDSSSSIHVSFYLTGLDILNFTHNTKSMTKTYHVRTDWRRFQVNLTRDFSLDTHELLKEPVARWQRINYTLNAKTHPAYYYNNTDSDTFDAEFSFILPSAATNIQALGDTIIFALPMSFEDSLLNSPFLILGALIAINIAFFLYRKIRK